MVRRRLSPRAAACLLLSATAPSLFHRALAQAPLEPPDGQLYLGAWVDTTTTGADSPSAFNQRIGRNAYVHQLAQTIPITSYSYVTGHGGEINETLIELTGSGAAVYLTVYPTSLGDIQSSDYDALGKQILGYQQGNNRSVFLRFAPEMQGNWMTYGKTPTQFKSVWKDMYTAIKTVAPDTAIVWSPNDAQGYPYGIKYSDVNLTIDQIALDTNNNGQLDSGDDAYAPYYPGDEYVDWVGLSWYWKGTTYPYTDNQVQPAGYTDGAMTGLAPPGALSDKAGVWTPFYETYCSGKSKPCMFSEMGAAYHVNASGTGASQLDIETAWWQNTLTNTTFLDTYPKIKLMMLFEHQKLEDEQDMRDFRLTMDDGVRNAFLNDLNNVADRYIWAANKTIPDSAIASAAGQTGTNAYTGKLSSGLPVQTLSPNVFTNSAARSTAGLVVGAMAASMAVGGWLVLASRF